jgi:predicted SAM-dependent methyltransferase
LKELNRILKTDGVLKISVPDLEILAKLLVHPELNFKARFHVMRMIMGGQIDPYDYHKVGFTFEFMQHFLGQAGFKTLKRVKSHGIFNDTSDFTPYGVQISLNVEARK